MSFRITCRISMPYSSAWGDLPYIHFPDTFHVHRASVRQYEGNITVQQYEGNMACITYRFAVRNTPAHTAALHNVKIPLRSPCFPPEESPPSPSPPAFLTRQDGPQADPYRKTVHILVFDGFILLILLILTITIILTLLILLMLLLLPLLLILLVILVTIVILVILVFLVILAILVFLAFLRRKLLSPPPRDEAVPGPYPAHDLYLPRQC
jgi:hypothetical protein